jgi:hypothetical protein
VAALTFVKFRLVTVVWGREFVDRFLDITLRSLASENNLPALAAKYDVTYEIIALAEDIAWLRDHPVYAAIAPRVVFVFRPFSSSDIDMKNSMSHWILWNQAIERAKKDDVYVITVAADHIFADGAMTRWAELFAQGYLAIFCPGMQVVAETITDELNTTFGDSTAVTLPRDTMIALMFRHFHPVMLAMCRTSPRWMAHPEFHLRTVKGQGIVQRIMTSHSVAFHPGRMAMTENFCPREQFDKVAYEPSWFLSAEPFLKYLNLYLRPWRMDDMTLSHYGVWGDGFFLPANLIESGHTYSYALATGAMPEATLRREQLGAGLYVAQMNAARAIYRVWRALHDNSLHQAARWTAAAHIMGRLRRRLAMRGPATVLVPEDTAIGHLVGDEAGRLLAGNATALVEAVRGHVFVGRIALKAGDRLTERADGPIKSLGGTAYAAGKGGPIKVLRGPIEIDDFTLWVVDRPLSNVAQVEVTAGDRVRLAGVKAKAHLRRHARTGRNLAVNVLRKNRRLYMAAVRWRDALPEWRQQPGLPAPVSQAAPAGLALYRRALKGVAHRALTDLFSMYQRCVLEGTTAISVPADKVAAIPLTPATTTAALLEQAVDLSPEFGEAWLELGYARRELGDRSGARAAFDRSRQLRSLQPARRGQADLRAIATLEWACETVAQGGREEALGVLSSPALSPPQPWQFHALKAELLRGAGQANAALIECERSMEWNHYEGRFEGMLPRVIDELLDDG